jgi:tRNA(Arg) A34 adenosine deaminase TadA
MLVLATHALAYLRWHLHDRRVSIDDALVGELEALGTRALQAGDIPIAAVVVLEGEVIGRGFNTVLAKGQVGGHAEINALSDAIARLGFAGFAALDRDRLRVISTLEPCLMCRAACIEYGVRHIEFLREKPLGLSLRASLVALLSSWRMKRREPAELHERLSLQHPDYPWRPPS